MLGEEPLHLRRIGGIAGIGFTANLRAQRLELVDISRGKCDMHPFARQESRQRRTQAVTGADDQGLAVYFLWHLK